MAPKKRKASASPPVVKKEVKGEVQDDVKSASTARFDPLVPLAERANWPAPAAEMRAATDFLQSLLDGRIELSETRPLVILPDKDADGLCSGQILHRTLEHLGVHSSHIRVHHLSKGTHVASASELDSLRALNPAACVVLDQGSRPGPPLLPDQPTLPVLVIDHHFLKPGETGPQGSLMVNASHSPPIATSSLLTWTICRPLWRDAASAEKRIDWLSLLGTCGDLSVNVEWEPPMPDFTAEMKKWSKKRIGTAIALLNAPRRTPEFDVAIAYASLSSAETPLELLDPSSNKNAARLYAAREAVAAETERCTHTAPKFAKDGRLAVLFINSPYQIHPSIATRWSGALRGAKNLQVVMCANEGYSPHGTHTHFSCRRAGAALKRGENPNIIAMLHDYAARDPTFLADVVRVEAELEKSGHGELKEGGGDAVEAPPAVKREDDDGAGGDADNSAVEALNFARGHREASGGVSERGGSQTTHAASDISLPPTPPSATDPPARPLQALRGAHGDWRAAGKT